MADISISIDDTSARRWLHAAPGALGRAMRGGMNDATALVLRDLSTYPRQARGSSYVRTHTLQRSWSRDISGDGLEIVGIVGSNPNMAPYNREVQDAEQQTAQHRATGWPTVQGVRENRERTIREMFEARVEEELR